MKSAFLAVVFGIVAVTLTAGDPPPLPKVLPPLISVPLLRPVDPPSRTQPFQPVTPDLILHLDISPWLRDFLLAELKPATPHQLAMFTSSADAIAEASASGPQHLLPYVLVTPVGTEVLQSPENGFNHMDQEPVVITNMWSHWYGDEYRTLYAFMRYPVSTWSYNTNGPPVLFVGRGSDQSQAQLPLPTDPNGLPFVSSGDPAIAANLFPYGIKPLRIYIAGTTYNSSWTQLSVWHTDDGGLSGWSLPATCGDASRQPISRSSHYLLDKPHIQVSYNPATLGWAYAVASKVDESGAEPTIFNVYRSTDGDTFNLTQHPIMADGLMPTTTLSVSPQLVVDYSTGDVCVFWLDSSTTPGRLYGVRSSDYGDNWQPVTSISAGQLIDYRDGKICQNGSAPQHCIEARSMLAAKFSPKSRTVGLTWAAREAGVGTDTEVHFAAYNLDSGVWNTSTLVRDRSQWAPAIDYDNYGNFVLAYYDRYDDVNDIRFTIYSSKMGPTALQVGANVRLPTSAVSADPGCPGCDTDQTWRFGEYQGLWTLNGYVYSTFFYSPQGSPDIYSAYLSLP